MGAKIHDFDGVVSITAPSGGLTVDTIVDFQDAIIMPLETKAAAATCRVLVLNAIASKKITGAPAEGGSGLAWVALQVLYWDKTNNRWTTTASGNTATALAAAAKAAAATTGNVIPLQTAANIN